MGPLVAPAGTGTWILFEFQDVGVPATPLNVTVLVPCGLPKLEPEIVIDVPMGAELDDKLAIAGVTVNVIPLLEAPFTLTTTGPVVAPEGTGAWMLPLAQLVGDAFDPLNVTVLVPCDPPKFWPPIVTLVPAGPKDGVRPVMLGGCGCGTMTVES